MVVVLELGHDGHRSKRIEADEQLHRLGDVNRSVPSNAHRASAGCAGRHVEAVVNVDVLDGLAEGDVVLVFGDVGHGHCTCWSMMETSVRRPRAGCCTRMMIGAPGRWCGCSAGRARKSLSEPRDVRNRHRRTRTVCTLVHFGAVVADAPSPLSTPRCATGQAQLRLGKPLRMKCRASPVLLFMRAGRVVSGTVGIVRATVPFHGEHDAPEPTK